MASEQDTRWQNSKTKRRLDSDIELANNDLYHELRNMFFNENNRLKDDFQVRLDKVSKDAANNLAELRSSALKNLYTGVIVLFGFSSTVVYSLISDHLSIQSTVEMAKNNAEWISGYYTEDRLLPADIKQNNSIEYLKLKIAAMQEDIKTLREKNKDSK